MKIKYYFLKIHLNWNLKELAKRIFLEQKYCVFELISFQKQIN